MQAVLYENSSDIQYNYQDVHTQGHHDKGETATVGIENGNGTIVLKRSFDQPVIDENYSIRFFHPAMIANEAEGRTAIETGITNALGSTTIRTDQQVYTRDTSNVQQLGTFDKFVGNATKRWSFNYITTGESYTNMNNVSNTVYILEMTELTTTQITQLVEDLIKGTV